MVAAGKLGGAEKAISMWNDKNPDAKVEAITKDVSKADFDKHKAALQKLLKEKRGGECKDACAKKAERPEDRPGLIKEACMTDAKTVGDDAKCDALKDASDDAKTECKKWSGKDCGAETDEAKKKECVAAKASAKALAASLLAVASIAALM
jgi:hypothetical protein